MAVSAKNPVKSRLYMPAFVVLVVVCALIVAIWRVHRVTFVSVHRAVTISVVRRGDALVARQVTIGSLRPGDIVSYYVPENTQNIETSRVSAVPANQSVFLVESVNGRRPVAGVLLIGKAEYRLAGMGYLLDALRSRVGLAVGVYIPAVVIVWDELRILSSRLDHKRYRLFGHPVWR